MSVSQHPLKNKILDLYSKKDLENHIVGCCHTIRNLAMFYSYDPNLAEMAALFHDLAKNMNEVSYINYINNHHINLDNFEKNKPGLAHGKVAAYILQHKYSVKDKTILDAVKYHTFGYPKNNPYLSLLYIADFTEPGRKFRNNINIKKLTLNQAALEICKIKLNHLFIKNKVIHPLGLKFYNWLVQNIQ